MKVFSFLVFFFLIITQPLQALDDISQTPNEVQEHTQLKPKRTQYVLYIGNSMIADMLHNIEMKGGVDAYKRALLVYDSAEFNALAFLHKSETILKMYSDIKEFFKEKNGAIKSRAAEPQLFCGSLFYISCQKLSKEDIDQLKEISLYITWVTRDTEQFRYALENTKNEIKQNSAFYKSDTTFLSLDKKGMLKPNFYSYGYLKNLERNVH